MLVGPQSPKYHYYTTKLLSLMNVTVESSRGYMTCDDVTALMAMTSFKYFSVFLFFFLGLQLLHMKIPQLDVKLEL